MRAKVIAIVGLAAVFPVEACDDAVKGPPPVIHEPCYPPPGLFDELDSVSRGVEARNQRRLEQAQQPSSASTEQPSITLERAPPPPTFNRDSLLRKLLDTRTARDVRTRKVFGATAMGVNYARYVEDWRLKVEAIGNVNYPQEAREKNLSGTLRLMVALRADGTIESIELERSSGHKVLDEAAERIVRLGAPYAPFPDALRRDTDILEIIRTFTFSLQQKTDSALSSEK